MIFPFFIFDCILFKVILTIASKDIDSVIEFDSFLQNSLVFHTGVPDVGLFS